MFAHRRIKPSRRDRLLMKPVSMTVAPALGVVR